MKDIIYWVWLAERNGAGRADAIKLLKHFPGGAKGIYEASYEQLSAVKECSPSFISRLENRDLSHAGKILEFCFMNGIRIIPCSSENYPARLQRLYNKPVVLYVRGVIDDLNERFCVSIVGTRSMSSYGKHMAFTLARQLIAYGAIIISGAAYGVDSAANNTAVYLEEPTVAVLGSGVNVPYPSKNKEMLDYIGSRGMVISEFPPNTPPYGKNFPIRNRIISGLADAVIVVEAGAKSGAQITAQYAADQGRVVYAVPGNIGAPNSIGTNRMIRDGAKPVTCTEDIIEDFAERFKLAKIDRIVNSDKYMRYEYNHDIPILPENRPISPKEQDRMEAMAVPKINQKDRDRVMPDIHDPREYRHLIKEADTVFAGRRAEVGKPPEKEAHEPDAEKTVEESLPEKTLGAQRPERARLMQLLDETQKKVLDAIPDTVAATSDRIIRACGLPTEEVLSTLTMLELYAAVEALPGDLYKKII